MKKIICIILAIVMACGFVGCGGSDEIASSPDATMIATSEPTAEPTPLVPETAIEEQVIVDNDILTITAKSFAIDASIFGPSIKLLIENHSNKTIIVQSRDASVNGYMIDTTFSSTIDPGKKSYDNLVFDSTDLKNANITTLADIEFVIYAFDNDTWDDVFVSDIINIQTSSANGFEFTYDDSGTEIFNNESVKIIYQGMRDDPFWGFDMMFYIENNGEKSIIVQVESASINGFMVDPIISPTICANKRIVDDLTILQSDLEDNEITTLENVEISFRIIDGDSWNTLYTTEPFTIEF